MQWYFIVLIVIAALALLFSIAVAAYFSNMVLNPKTHDEIKETQELLEQKRLTEEFTERFKNAEKFTVKSDFGYDLYGYIVAGDPKVKFADGKRRVLVCVHGYTSCSCWMMRYGQYYSEMGFDCVLYDHRNHGATKRYNKKHYHTTMGKFEKYDLDKIVNFAVEKFGDDCILGTVGESMGAATVMLHAGMGNKHLAFVHEDCGYSRLHGQLKHNLCDTYHFTELPYMWFAFINMLVIGHFNLYKVRPIDGVKANPDIPMLFVHGTADKFINPEMVQENYDAKQGKKMLYMCEGAEHACSIVVDPEKYREVIREFVTTNGLV